MATANGTLTPPAASATPATTAPMRAPSTGPADASAAKRKREADREQHGASRESTQMQRDILALLQRHDPAPSFLNHEFAEAAPDREPAAKKARLSDAEGKTSIAAKLASGAYVALSTLAEDAARVSRDLEAALRAKGKEEDGARDGGRLPVEHLKQIQRAKGMAELISAQVDRESQYAARRAVAGESGSRVPGLAAPAEAAGTAGTLLTLFGNAPTPKQLFSSLQNPTATSDPVIERGLPVDEVGLPNGLTATRILPAPVGDTDTGPTFDQVFAPPYHLPALNPPKPLKRSSTRDTTLLWQFRDPINRGSRKGGYTVQSQTAGDWLGYAGVDPSGDSTKDRRKQRERTLSRGESELEPANDGSLEEQAARAEEALFRRAYSSFAPSHDDSRAVIPAETRAMIWWHKLGERRFNERLAIDPALAEEDSAQDMPSLPAVPDGRTAEQDFGHAIKELEELDELDEDGLDVKQVTDKTDVENVLREISQLLETLASYQRIRNATLTASTAATRTPISPSPLIMAKNGTPDEPGEHEVATYHALQRELAYLILKLPPYAVAKLDGDQLADLGVRKLIKIYAPDIRGTMEEDSVARLAKHQAMATAAGIASLTRTSSSTSGQHYSSGAQRTPAIGQAANTRYGQTPQYSARTPAPAQPQYQQRSTSNQSTYGTPSTAPRPTYNAQHPNQYTRPGAPQQPTAYAQANGQQYYQPRPPSQPQAQETPSTTNTSYQANPPPNQQQPQRHYPHYQPQQSSSTPSTHQAPRPNYAPQQQQQQQPPPPLPPPQQQPGQHQNPAMQAQAQAYANRSHAAAASAVAYQTQPQRTASPSLQPRPSGMQYTSQQQQQQQGNSGRGTPVAGMTGAGSGPQTPVNGFARPSAPPPPPVQGQAQVMQGQQVRAGSGTPGPGPTTAMK